MNNGVRFLLVFFIAIFVVNGLCASKKSASKILNDWKTSFVIKSIYNRLNDLSLIKEQVIASDKIKQWKISQYLELSGGRREALDNGSTAIEFFIKDGVSLNQPAVQLGLFDICLELIKRGRYGDKPVATMIKMFVTDKEVIKTLLTYRTGGQLYEMCLILLEKGQHWWINKKTPILDPSFLFPKKDEAMEEEGEDDGDTETKEDKAQYINRQTFLHMYILLISQAWSAQALDYQAEGLKVFNAFKDNLKDAYSAEWALLGIELQIAACKTKNAKMPEEELAKTLNFLSIIDKKDKSFAAFFEYLPITYFQLHSLLTPGGPNNLLVSGLIKKQALLVFDFFMKELEASKLGVELQVKYIKHASMLVEGQPEGELLNRGLKLIKFFVKKENFEKFNNKQYEPACKNILNLSILLAEKDIKDSFFQIISLFSPFDWAKEQVLTLGKIIATRESRELKDRLNVLEFFGIQKSLDSDENKRSFLKTLLTLVKDGKIQKEAIKAFKLFFDEKLINRKTNQETLKLVLDICVELLKKESGKDLSFAIVRSLLSYTLFKRIAGLDDSLGVEVNKALVIICGLLVGDEKTNLFVRNLAQVYFKDKNKFARLDSVLQDSFKSFFGLLELKEDGVEKSESKKDLEALEKLLAEKILFSETDEAGRIHLLNMCEKEVINGCEWDVVAQFIQELTRQKKVLFFFSRSLSMEKLVPNVQMALLKLGKALADYAAKFPAFAKKDAIKFILEIIKPFNDKIAIFDTLSLDLREALYSLCEALSQCGYPDNVKNILAKRETLQKEKSEQDKLQKKQEELKQEELKKEELLEKQQLSPQRGGGVGE